MSRSTGVYHEQRVFYVADRGDGKPVLVSNFVTAPLVSGRVAEGYYGNIVPSEGDLVVDPTASYVPSGLSDTLKRILVDLCSISQHTGVSRLQSYLSWNETVPEWDPDLSLQDNLSGAILSLSRATKAFLYSSTGAVEGYFDTFVNGAKATYMHSNLADTVPPTLLSIAYTSGSYSGAGSNVAWNSFPGASGALVRAIKFVFSEPMNTTTLSDAIGISWVSGSTENDVTFTLVNDLATSGNSAGDQRTYVAYSLTGKPSASYQVTLTVNRDLAMDKSDNLLQDMVTIKFYCI